MIDILIIEAHDSQKLKLAYRDHLRFSDEGFLSSDESGAVCQWPSKRQNIGQTTNQQMATTTPTLPHSEPNPQYRVLTINAPQNNPYRVAMKRPLESFRFAPQLLQRINPNLHCLRLRVIGNKHVPHFGQLKHNIFLIAEFKTWNIIIIPQGFFEQLILLYGIQKKFEVPKTFPAYYLDYLKPQPYSHPLHLICLWNLDDLTVYYYSLSFHLQNLRNSQLFEHAKGYATIPKRLLYP